MWQEWQLNLFWGVENIMGKIENHGCQHVFPLSTVFSTIDYKNNHFNHI